MASAISNRYYDRVINTTKLAMLAFGFILIMMLLSTVTTNKLDRLREQMALAQPEVVTLAERTKQLDCLTKNIYWEAASEPFEGKVAVAQVTMNRVHSGRFGAGVCGVVYQKNVFYEKVVCQFSWACENTHKIKPVYAAMYKESEDVAKKVLLEGFKLDGLKDALYYHAAYVHPAWRKQKISQIGQHIFYKD